MSKKKAKKGRKRRVIVFVLLAALCVAVLIFGRHVWESIFLSNVPADTDRYLYIRTGSSYDDVLRLIDSLGLVGDMESFKFVAEKKGYARRVLPGKYKIEAGMSNNELVNLLRSGRQTPVQLSFISVRTDDILAGKLSSFIEADSVEILSLLRSRETAQKYGFDVATFKTMFIPNTYEVYWNTSAEQLIGRMAKEYKKFWTSGRKQKAAELGLTQSEVSILASIVEAETQNNGEKATIAGVYVNRLNRKMLLQADPTVVFATGDFTIKRILNKHLEIESPYNTYKHAGLPPGPINIPSPASIDAVLNYEHHDYLYFCAKDDFSGCHVFAKTAAGHAANARKYHQALRKNHIR